MRRWCGRLWLGLWAVATAAQAQEIEPRAFSNIPLGVNFLVAGYAHSAGGLATDPALQLENAELRTDSAFVAYVRSIEWRGQSGKVDAVLPYAWLAGEAEFRGEPAERVVSGCGDPRLRLTVNLLGAPALSVAELASYRQDVIVGLSLAVSVPVGQYDAERLVNIGTNRWAIKTELGGSRTVGAWTLEGALAATLFQDNDDFFGGRSREQDPVYSLQAGVVYGFGRGVWAALSGTYYTGGRARIDGGEADDLQRNSALGLTLALPIDRRHSVKLYANTGLHTRIGTDTDTVGIAWQYRWGGGL